MFLLTITFDKGASNVVLAFQTEEKALAVAERVLGAQADMTTSEPFFKVFDDCGRTAFLPLDSLMLLIVSDRRKELMAQGEDQLDQARAQVELNRRAQSDPVLRLVGAVNNARAADGLLNP